MIQIKDTVVSLDLLEEFFVCDYEKCKGECCIEGDAGAPITEDEKLQLEKALPAVRHLLTPSALKVIDSQGVSYIDEEGDLVTSIVNGRDCVFTTYAPGGKCLCALEKVWREGKTNFSKPISCRLYPVRIDSYPAFTAVNYHRWEICRCAVKLGRKERVRVYEYLKEPLIARFGQDWYDELDLTAREYISQKQSQ